MSAADKWRGSVASSRTQSDCISLTKSWVGAPGEPGVSRWWCWWGLIKCAEAQRGSICGCSSVNILSGMWKLGRTTLHKSAAAAEEIRAGLKHCWVSGAARINAAAVTPRLRSLPVGSTSWQSVKYDPHDGLYNWYFCSVFTSFN